MILVYIFKYLRWLPTIIDTDNYGHFSNIDRIIMVQDLQHV